MEKRLSARVVLVGLVALVAVTSCGESQGDTLSTVPPVTPESRPKAVDRTLRRQVDVTGDGVKDNVVLRVWGANVRTPFKWQLVIWSGEKKVFSYSGDSSSFDAFFADDGYVGECTGYVDCKERFFYREILDNVIVPAPEYAEISLDESASYGLYTVGRSFLKKCCALDGAQADVILASIADKLRSKRAVVMSNLTSGISMEPHAAVFAPEVGRFVPIFEP